MSSVHMQQDWFLTYKRMFFRRFLRQKISEPQRTTAISFMLNVVPFELPVSDICYPMFWNTGSGGIDIFVL